MKGNVDGNITYKTTNVYVIMAVGVSPQTKASIYKFTDDEKKQLKEVLSDEYMASIVKKCNKYYVVYRYLDDKSVPKQKWECFNAKVDASKRKKEIEFQEQTGILVVPKAITVAEMLEEFVSVYGINKWALSTYQTK